MKSTMLSIAALVLALGTAAAQAQQPNTPSNDTSGDGNLSRRLNQSNGVIRPRGDIDPDISKPAPVPNPNSTPVIPPPGSPGGNQSVQPK